MCLIVDVGCRWKRKEQREEALARGQPYRVVSGTDEVWETRRRFTPLKVVAFSNRSCLMLLNVGRPMFVSLCGRCYLLDSTD